ncbi:ATP-binding protein, partial [Streptococcus agalactiae]
IVIPPAIFFYYSTLFDSRFKTLQQNPQEPDDSNSGDDEATAFGTYFCFHNDSEKSPERVLSRLKIAVTDDSKVWFDTLTRGQCLFKDTFGRVERITVDGLFPEVNQLFKTVRVNKQKEVA